jgi:hypothetical protein
LSTKILENPFDIAKNSFLGIDSRKARRKKIQRDKQNFDDINDVDVKRELRKGHTLLSCSEYQPQ